jgi:hypothetical protein
MLFKYFGTVKLVFITIKLHDVAQKTSLFVSIGWLFHDAVPVSYSGRGMFSLRHCVQTGSGSTQPPIQ